MKTNRTNLPATALFLAAMMFGAHAFCQSAVINPATGRPDPSRGGEMDHATGLPTAGTPNRQGAGGSARSGDAYKIRAEARALTEAGRYQEALQRFEWYNSNATVDRALPALLSDWIELGRHYPKALQSLVEIRDADSQQLQKSSGGADLFQEIAAIDAALQQEGATARLFKTIDARNPRQAQECYVFAERSLVQSGEYQLCLRYLGDVEDRLETLSYVWQMQNASMQYADRMRAKWQQKGQEALVETGHANIADLNAKTWSNAQELRKKFQTDSYVGQVRQWVEILVGAGQKSEAEKIRDRAVAVLDDERLRSAVADAEKKIQK
jgi:tetratricopeptide (TPR) repeat protein